MDPFLDKKEDHHHKFASVAVWTLLSFVILALIVVLFVTNREPLSDLEKKRAIEEEVKSRTTPLDENTKSQLEVEVVERGGQGLTEQQKRAIEEEVKLKLNSN